MGTLPYSPDGIAGLAGVKTAADDHVGTPCQRLEQHGNIARIVLTVSVELEGALVPLLNRPTEPCAKSTTDSQVEGQADDDGPVTPSHRRSVVRRAIVDHQDIGVGDGPHQLVQRAANGLGLLVRRNDGKQSAAHFVVSLGTLDRG